MPLKPDNLEPGELIMLRSVKNDKKEGKNDIGGEMFYFHFLLHDCLNPSRRKSHFVIHF